MKELIEHLEGLASRKIEVNNKKAGLCNELQVEFHLSPMFIQYYVEDWPHFSGDVTYPVPPSSGNMKPWETYHYTKNKWAYNQGKLRRNLCQHIANKLREENEHN